MSAPPPWPENKSGRLGWHPDRHRRNNKSSEIPITDLLCSINRYRRLLLERCTTGLLAPFKCHWCGLPALDPIGHAGKGRWLCEACSDRIFDIVTLPLTGEQGELVAPLVRRQAKERKGLLLVSVAPDMRDGRTVFRLQACFLPWPLANRVLRIIREAKGSETAASVPVNRAGGVGFRTV